MRNVEFTLRRLTAKLRGDEFGIFLGKSSRHHSGDFRIMPQLQDFLSQTPVGNIVAAASGLENMRRIFAQPELVSGFLNGLEPGALNELKQARSA